jgi:methyl-accepting chemotaxis protein
VKILDNTQIGTKLIGSFLILAIMLGGVALFGLLNMQTINNGVTTIYDDRLIPITQLEDANNQLFKLRGDLYRYLVIPEDRKNSRTAITADIANISARMDEFRKQNLLSSETEELKKFDGAWNAYAKLVAESMDNIDQGKEKEVLVSWGTGDALKTRQQSTEALTKLIAINKNEADLVKKHADQVFSGSAFAMAIVGILGFVVAIVLGIVISRSIRIPLQEGVTMMEEMTRGHFSRRLNLSRNDEIGKLAHSMDVLASDLQNLVVGTMKGIAAGDLSLRLTPKGDDDELTPSMITMLDTLRALVTESSDLCKASIQGRLSTRGNAARFTGGYREIIEGINATLDAIMVPISEAMRVSARYAERDFSARMDTNLVMEGDYFSIKEALDNIGIAISGTVATIQDQLDRLTAATAEATASISEISSGSAQVARNSGAVSANAEMSERAITQILRAMEDLSQTVNQVSLRTDQVAKLTLEANHLSQEGADMAEKAGIGMEGITTATNEVGGIITGIRDQMGDIGRIVGIISDIAEQTNLLALNAAIEAARAGDAGLGFAVVAAEVKTLAQEVQKSAENIAGIIGSLQSQSETVATAMERSTREVETGADAVARTVTFLKEIVASVDEISSNITDVASNTEEQAASVEEVTASINEVSSLISNTSHEAGDAAVASRDSSAAIDQITMIISGVNASVQEISAEMKKFTT